jgi:hypothetical protein
MARRAWRTDLVASVRVGLACIAGAATALAIAFFGWAVPAFIPGTPQNALLRGSVGAAARGQGEYLRYLLGPESEAAYRAGIVCYDLTALPLSVIAGSIVAGRLGGGSWLCAALGGMLPALTLTLVGPFGGAEPGIGLRGVLLIIAAAWAASLALLRLWERRCRHRRSAAKELG